MIEMKDVSFGFPQKDLYNHMNFTIEDGEHAVLIGSNGTGKSTLVNLILTPEIYTYEGIIKRDRNARIGYVSQFVKHESEDVTAYEYLYAPFEKLQLESDAICAQMESGEYPDGIFDRYQEVLDEMDAVGFYDSDTNIRKMLASANLTHVEALPVSKISGGEYKLLSIMRNMLQKPQLLIMDEPDVFLDFENLIALTGLINAYDGTLLVITHSRLLLNQCFDKVLHIENEELQEFPGTYAEYRKAMLETKIDMAEHVKTYDDEIKAQEQVVVKLRALATNNAEPRTGKQLKARVSYLERLKARRGKNPFIEEHDYDFTLPALYAPSEGSDEDTENQEVCSADESVNAAQIADVPEAQNADETVLAVSDYSLAFDRELLSNVSFTVKAGEKIAIVGSNGTGKSSLLNDLYRMAGSDGTAMFRQIYDNDNAHSLSGGERNIRQLHEICASDARILFLDEPTSHLDIYAQMALEQAIREYQGTVLMVSHDFFTVTGCADRILILEDGTLREMSGRAYRKFIYKRYFDSDLFEQEKQLKETELRINALIKKGKTADARVLLEKM